MSGMGGIFALMNRLDGEYRFLFSPCLYLWDFNSGFLLLGAQKTLNTGSIDPERSESLCPVTRRHMNLEKGAQEIAVFPPHRRTPTPSCPSPVTHDTFSSDLVTAELSSFNVILTEELVWKLYFQLNFLVELLWFWKDPIRVDNYTAVVIGRYLPQFPLLGDSNQMLFLFLPRAVCDHFPHTIGFSWVIFGNPKQNSRFGGGRF